MKKILTICLLVVSITSYSQLDITKRKVTATENFYVRSDTVPNMTEVIKAITEGNDTINVGIYQIISDTDSIWVEESGVWYCSINGVVSYDGVVYDNYAQLISLESEGERRNAGFWADFNESGYGKTAMSAQGTKNTNELDLVLDTTGAYFEGITLNSDNWTDDHLVTKGYVDSIKTIINMNSDGSGYAHIFSDDAIQFYVYDAGGANPGAIELDNVNGNFSVLARGNNIMSVRNIVKGINIKTLSGSLTDGAPTSAEITSIVGYAANNSLTGKGYQVTIKDTDGSGLLYKVESDGTDWYYTVMTKAL